MSSRVGLITRITMKVSTWAWAKDITKLAVEASWLPGMKDHGVVSV